LGFGAVPFLKNGAPFNGDQMKHKAYMQVDFNNPVAVKYMKVALKSFEPVKDIFEIEPIQCVTPDTLLPELENSNYQIGSQAYKDRNWLPGEIGSFHSQFRMAKRIAEGEKLWVLEHDVYLRPERIDDFVALVKKSHEKDVMNIGTGMEIWTLSQPVAKAWNDYVIGNRRLRGGNMSALHKSTDRWAKSIKNQYNSIYWPARRMKDPRWLNLTGIGTTVEEAHTDPNYLMHTPCTQLVDPNYGASISDRECEYRAKTASDLATRHPDLKIISLD